MQVSDFHFFHIVGTSDRLIKNIIALLNDLRTSDRIAYYAFSNSGSSSNVGIVVGVAVTKSDEIRGELAYIGYVMGRHEVVPETVLQMRVPSDVDLTSPSCFTDDLPF